MPPSRLGARFDLFRSAVQPTVKSDRFQAQSFITSCGLSDGFEAFFTTKAERERESFQAAISRPPSHAHPLRPPWAEVLAPPTTTPTFNLSSRTNSPRSRTAAGEKFSPQVDCCVPQIIVSFPGGFPASSFPFRTVSLIFPKVFSLSRRSIRQSLSCPLSFPPISCPAMAVIPPPQQPIQLRV